MRLLGEIAEGHGDTASPDFVRQRELIERRHGGDDGTNIHYARQHGERAEYKDDLPDPISDASPVHCLAYYGLGVREMELLERHGCMSIGDVRKALDDCEIIAWSGGERKTENMIREAVEGIPK